MKKSLMTILYGVAVVLAALFGLTGAWIGAPNLLQWASMPGRTIAYYGISLLAGLVLLICSLLSIRGAWRRALGAGGVVAALALVLNQFLGLRFQAILCFTPT